MGQQGLGLYVLGLTGRCLHMGRRLPPLARRTSCRHTFFDTGECDLGSFSVEFPMAASQNRAAEGKQQRYGLDTVEVVSCDGARAVIALHGAHVLSWVPGKDEEDALFLSSQAIFDGQTPIRGGIPLVFPQFGSGKRVGTDEKPQSFSSLPSHGFARRSRWEVSSQTEDGSSATFKLCSNDKTMAQWPYEFAASYTVSLDAGGSLRLRLEIENKGDKAFDFCSLFHTYFHVDAMQARLRGLHTLSFYDQVSTKRVCPAERSGEREGEGDGDVIFGLEELDRIYLNVPPALELITGTGRVFKIELKASDGQALDAVVWNPHVAKSKRMKDFADSEWKEMVCVEPGNVGVGTVLLPGKTWAMTKTVTMSKI